MTGQLPVLKAKEVIEALGRAGFSLKRQSGSHAILFKRGSNQIITVPLHTGDIPKGTLRAVIRQCGLTVKQFEQLL